MSGRRLAWAAVAATAVVAGLLVWVAAGPQPPRVMELPVDAAGLEPAQRRVELTYAVRVNDLGAAPQRVEAWIPLPREHRDQSLERYALREGHPATVVEDPEFGNRFLRVDLTAAARAANGSPLPVTLELTVTRRAYSAWLRDEPPHRPRAGLASALEPDRLVPIDGFIADEARRVVGDAHEPAVKARRLYEHIVDTLAYDKSGDGWGRGDAVYACDVRRGNCTDFHSLFMAEARSVGIPARFVIGVPLPAGEATGTIPGYHCWSEFWLDERGWVPVDASEADKHPRLRQFFFGGLDAHRVEFTIGRDLDLPGAAAAELNYVIYPHVEVDGETHAAVDTEFRFRELEPPTVAAG